MTTPSSPSSPGRGLLLDAALIIGLCAIVGAACGWIWYAWWAPGPTAVVFEGKPYYRPDEEFAGSAMFATVAGAAGLLLGTICTWIFERDEVLTLGALVTGTAVGTGLMLLVGHVLGPDSAADAATKAEDGARLPGDLWVHAYSALASMPLAAVVAATLILVIFGRRGSGQVPRAAQSAESLRQA